MKNIFMAAMILLLVSVTHAGIVPSILPTTQDTHYYGAHDFSFDLGTEGVLNGRLEFAVYTGTQAEDMIDWTGYAGEADYVYAYQVFCDQSSTAGLTYFALTGVNPTTIASVEDDISEQEDLDSGLIPSGGVQPSDSYFNDSKEKAIWEFGDGAIVRGDQSWFLFLYSDYDWIEGGIEVQPPLANDDIPVPEVPEPATLALLACGAILSLKRRK